MKWHVQNNRNVSKFTVRTYSILISSQNILSQYNSNVGTYIVQDMLNFKVIFFRNYEKRPTQVILKIT